MSGTAGDLYNIAKSLGDFGVPVGFVFLVILILYGGFKQWWIWGWQLEEVRKDRDYYRAIALGATKVAAEKVS